MEGSLKIPQPFRGLFYRYLIAFYKRMDHLVVVNPTFIPKLVAYGIPQGRVTYIPNFVDDQRFYPVCWRPSGGNCTGGGNWIPSASRSSVAVKSKNGRASLISSN